MRSTLVFLGLLSVFMLVSSLPLGSATLEKGQTDGPTNTISDGPLHGGSKGKKGLLGLGILGL
jgi:hypothetical protein